MNTEAIPRRAPNARLGARLRRAAFGIPLIETTCARRGFQVSDAVKRERLERIGQMFVHGYHLALEDSDPAVLAPQLNATDSEFRGFAFEGAAMALDLLDRLTPWNRGRWANFVGGPGAPHIYMAHVGAGWAWARLGGKTERVLSRFDPLLRWLVVDGYGFHEGYFHWPRSVNQQERPARLEGYALRVFDQGLGRSMWFIYGADVASIPAVVASFAPERQADLWSGIGLACSYAGGADQAAIVALHVAAGPYQAHLAQGAAFAAQARLRANNLAAHTEIACSVLCKCSAAIAAAATDRALVDLPTADPTPSYEIWRQRIHTRFSEQGGAS